MDILTQLTDLVTCEIVRNPKRKLLPDTALLSSGLIDSFNLVDLAIRVEDVFGVHLDDSELNAGTFDTLEQLAQVIASRQK